MLGTNIKIKFKYLDTEKERAGIAFCVRIEFEDFWGVKRMKWDVYTFWKRELELKRVIASAVEGGWRVANEYHNTVKQMNVNGKGKHVSIINKANKVEGKILRERKFFSSVSTHWIDDGSQTPHFLLFHSFNIYLKSNVMDTVMAVWNEKKLNHLFFFIILQIELQHCSFFIVMCKKTATKSFLCWTAVHKRDGFEKPTRREQEQNWKSFSDSFWIMMMIFPFPFCVALPIFHARSQTSSTNFLLPFFCATTSERREWRNVG